MESSARTVRNLSTMEERVYVGISPESAVIAAYAASINDSNTWDYERKYASKITRGRKTVSIGDWCCVSA